MGEGSPGLIDLEIKQEDRTGANDPITGLYLPCLAHSIMYDRSTGYFKSSIFSLVADQICDFAIRGGRLRIVCSPDLTQDDISQLTTKETQEAIAIGGQHILQEIRELITEYHSC